MIRRSASILLVLLTSLVIGSEAEAQIFTLGVKGGGTFATISDPDGAFDDVGRRAGSVFGAYAQLGGRVGFRGEVLLVQKGFDGRQDGVDFEFDVDYVEIPALLVVRLGTGPVRPALYGGAAVGFERSCEFTARGTMLSASGDCDDPELDVEREELDAGAVFGAGSRHRIGRRRSVDRRSVHPGPDDPGRLGRPGRDQESCVPVDGGAGDPDRLTRRPLAAAPGDFPAAACRHGFALWAPPFSIPRGVPRPDAQRTRARTCR